MFLTKLKLTTAARLIVAALLLGGMLIPGLCALAQPSLAVQPAVLPDEKPGKKAPDAGQDSVKVVKIGKYVRSLAHCNDGKTVAVVIWEGTAREQGKQSSSLVLWDLQKGKVEQTLEKFGEGSLQFFHVCSSKDGTTIAASANDIGKPGAAIKVWEAKTGNLLQDIPLDDQQAGPRAVALSPDGKKVAGGTVPAKDADCKVFVWDVKSGELLKTLEAKGLAYYTVALSADGKWVAASGDVDGDNRKGKVVVWEFESGKLKHELESGGYSAVALSSDGMHVAAGGLAEVSTRVWDMKTGKLKHLLKTPEILGLAFSPDGKTLATAGTDHRVILWDVAKEKAQLTLAGHSDGVDTVAFSHDGRTLVSGSRDRTMRFWRLAPAGEREP